MISALNSYSFVKAINLLRIRNSNHVNGVIDLQFHSHFAAHLLWRNNAVRCKRRVWICTQVSVAFSLSRFAKNVFFCCLMPECWILIFLSEAPVFHQLVWAGGWRERSENWRFHFLFCWNVSVQLFVEEFFRKLFGSRFGETLSFWNSAFIQLCIQQKFKTFNLSQNLQKIHSYWKFINYCGYLNDLTNKTESMYIICTC